MRTPDRLKYGVEDRPAVAELAVLALQHASLALVLMIYPVAAAQAIGLDMLQTAALLSATILAVALATLMQVFGPPWGSGLPLVQIPTPVMLPAVVQAGLLGGPPMIAGMTLVLGLGETVLARGLKRLRAFFPPEVCGVAVMMLGVTLVTPALAAFTGVDGATPDGASRPRGVDLVVAGATLATIVAVAIFARGALELFALACGLGVGVVSSVLCGAVQPQAWARLQLAPWLGWPELAPSLPTLDLALLPLCLLMALVNTMDNLGVLVGAQRLVDADWRKIDMDKGAAGVQSVAAGNLAAGLLGAVPCGFSSAHVGLVFATGVAARTVCAAVAVALLVSLFTPKVVVALTLIPRPVIGALMVYTAAYMIVAGTELIQSRMLSERRLFTVGLSVVLGLSPQLLPGLWDGLPATIAPVFHSGLALSALSAVALTALFRLGITRRAAMPVPDTAPAWETAREFLHAQGRLWGARPQVVDRAVAAAAEALEAVRLLGGPTGGVTLEARFDESRLDVLVGHHGRALHCPEAPPSQQQLIVDDEALASLSGFLLRRSADRLVQRTLGGRHQIEMQFEH